MYHRSGATVGHAQHANDRGDGAHIVQVLRLRLLDLGILLAQHAKRTIAAINLLDQLDTAVPPHGDGDDNTREEHSVAQGKDGELGRSALRIHQLLVLGGDQRDQLGLVVDLS